MVSLTSYLYTYVTEVTVVTVLTVVTVVIVVTLVRVEREKKFCRIFFSLSIMTKLKKSYYDKTQKVKL